MKCTYCANEATLREHVIPKHMGGELVDPACARCNGIKLSRMPAIEWPVPPGLLRMVQLEYKRIRDQKSDHWTRDEQHQWANWESVVTHGPWLAGMQLAPQGQPPAP